MARYDVQYIIKADDDVFLRLDRVPHAARQWGDMHAGEGSAASGADGRRRDEASFRGPGACL